MVSPVPPLLIASGVVRVIAAAAIVPVNVGDALNTLDPVPVLVVVPVPPLATGRVPVTAALWARFRAWKVGAPAELAIIAWY